MEECGERNLVVDNRLKSFVPVIQIKGEVNSEYIRRMTPREWARLQGFPDSFKLVVADTHLYKQFGNSVTVPVVCEIAKCAKNCLNVSKEQQNKRGLPYKQNSVALRLR